MTPLKELLRLELRKRPMTTKELAAATGRRQSNMVHALKGMPDAYIKEWKEERRTGRPASVWSVVVPPENARHPEKKR